MLPEKKMAGSKNAKTYVNIKALWHQSVQIRGMTDNIAVRM
jgi:hypothetical protein